jgi:3-oxoacyl-[acyl-carrier-protein] synthase-3
MNAAVGGSLGELRRETDGHGNAEDLGIAPDKLVINLDRYGNTSAGSIPLALGEVLVAGRLNRGDHLLLSGFGAGLAWGTAVLRW